MNHFEYGLSTFYFGYNPSKEASVRYAFYQVEGRDSLGQRYCYQKSNIYHRIYSLSYDLQTNANKEDFITFIETVIQGTFNNFTWYDNENVAHNVFITNGSEILTELKDQNKITFELEEEVSHTLPIFTSAFTNKEAHPIWFIKVIINSVTYYFSDGSYYITPLGITTIPRIQSWGSFESTLDNLRDISFSDFEIDVISKDTVVDAGDNLIYLVTTYEIEKESCELFLWFAGQLELEPIKFKGYVRDITVDGVTHVNLVIEDKGVRLDNYIGEKLNQTTYPLADVDDVGKVIPIIINNPSKVPALCVDSGWSSVIKDAFSAEATEITVSELPYVGSVIGKVIQIDDEKVYISDATEKVLTITRGYDSTTATQHDDNCVFYEVKTTPLVYLVANHSVDSIGNIFSRTHNVDIDITSDCTKYTGNSGDQLTGYEGKAVVTIPDIPVVHNKVIQFLIDNKYINDSGHSHTTGSTSSSMTQNCNDVLPKSATLLNVAPSNPTQFYDVVSVTFADVGEVTACTYNINVTVFNGAANRSTSIRWRLLVGANIVYESPSTPVSNLALTIPITNQYVMQYNTVTIQMSNDLYYTIEQIGPARFNSITRSITYIVGGTGTTTASAQTALAGTTLLSGNSTANVLIGEQILVDVVKTRTIKETFDYLISLTGLNESVWLEGDPYSYVPVGIINDYKKGREWLNRIAFQLGYWFDTSGAYFRLVKKPTTLISEKTISACTINSDGVYSLTRKKVSKENVINTITLLYNRDYTKSGDDAYQSSVAGVDSVSVINYGELEQPDLFCCDFIFDGSHATNIKEYYLDFYGTRKWIYEFETFLDYSDVKFGMVVTLGFAENKVGIVIGVNPQIGSKDNIDKIKFKVLV